ncbi:hypothetical protein COLO4_10014 [Corchorus olitorius]|uniref:Uncharacterized protein n=1 Tax=Corchorus olitorius TaxID=93759 RepID=A0A1R3KAC8_9ROSI|nr:hypothetical protein COLO4_10014 [Corchorus olitorius]
MIYFLHIRLSLEASIAKRTDEIAKLRKMKEPLGGDIRRCKAQLRSLENRHIEITRKLDQFETDIVLWNYQLNHNLEGKKKATE